MKQKKIVSMTGMLILLISVILVTGCSSMRPVGTTAQFPADGSKYVILGRVEYQGQTGKGNFEVVNDGGTFKAKITNATFAGIPQFDQTIPFVDKKLNIFGIGTFDFKDIL